MTAKKKRIEINEDIGGARASRTGIDIVKHTFQLHGADNSGKAVHKKCLARRELAAHVANLPACTIVMEACG
jgi:transposase